jgi:hypothetical protein
MIRPTLLTLNQWLLIDGPVCSWGLPWASCSRRCAARPCLAVFAGQIPEEEQRSAVIQRLLESHPGIHLRSTTILGESGRVSWVLGLADEEPTREENALIDTRIDDLLLR